MCGRYGITATEQELFERYRLSNTYQFKFAEDNEIFPTTNNPILLPNRKFYALKWGFTPDFAKRPLINARAETVMEKPTFREPFAKKRCIIPATHFYEWKKKKDEKQKIKIEVSDLKIFSMAGICERYNNEEGESILAYSILTTASNDQMSAIHDRIPVILEPTQERTYLDLSVDPFSLLPMLESTERQLIFTEVD